MFAALRIAKFMQLPKILSDDFLNLEVIFKKKKMCSKLIISDQKSRVISPKIALFFVLSRNAGKNALKMYIYVLKSRFTN